MNFEISCRYSNQVFARFAHDRSSLTDQFVSASFFIMSVEQLKQEAMDLPLLERVSLAQALWESIDAGLSASDGQDALREAIRRDQELSSGRVAGRTHDEVMQAARRAIGCD